MVDAVVQLAISDPVKKAEWATLLENISEKAKARNELAHHEVYENGALKPGRRLALRPALLNPHSPDLFKDIGLHVNELRTRQTVFHQLGDKVRQFYSDLCELLGPPQEFLNG